MLQVEFRPGYSQFQAGSAGQAYNEAAFRHFLAVDRRRAERAIRPLLLALVSVRDEHVGLTRLTDATAAAIFMTLGDCVREVDFVGWYREGRVPGAVLVQPMNALSDVRGQLSDRIVQALRTHLSFVVMRGLRVRVVSLGASR